MFACTAEEIVEDHGDGENFVKEKFPAERLFEGIDSEDPAFLHLVKSSSGLLPRFNLKDTAAVRLSKRQDTYDFLAFCIVDELTTISIVFSCSENENLYNPKSIEEARIANKIIDNLNLALWDFD